MTIKKDLQIFYDLEADKYACTRKKHRPEADLLLDELSCIEKKSIKILELGCWWWRFLSLLSKIKDKKIVYTWVDLSKNLLDIAEKDFKKTNNTNINASFICDDMINYISKPKQESFDVIVCIASFQHIPNQKERLFLLKNFYRILNYEWKVIMTNRSFSLRFIKKYYKVILKWFIKQLAKYWKFNFKDIEIPWKSNQTTHKRYYHIFTLKELSTLCKLSWFIKSELCYLNKSWKKSIEIKDAKNTLLVMSKNI